MASQPELRMTIPTQLVLQALLTDPGRELYGLEIGTAAGLPSGTVHPILARLDAGAGSNHAGRKSIPASKADRHGGTTASPATASTAPRKRFGGRTDRRLLACGCGRLETCHDAGPYLLPVRMVELAARTLPVPHRGRYTQEFTAELYGLTRSHELRHATQVLSHAWVLRAALGEPAPVPIGDGTMQIAQRRPLTCLLLGWHKWKSFSTDDGSARYNQCVKCGKEQWQPNGGGSNTIGA
jgi:hypothetical protein